MKITNNMKTKLITSFAAAMAAFVISANAAVISVNIGNSSANNNISATDTAGVVAVNNWNNKLGSFGAAAVTDDSGTLLATTVSVNTQWSGGLSAAAATPNHALMGSGTDSGGGDMSATVTGITFDLYDVYVYFKNSGDRYGDYSVTPSGTGAAGGGLLRGYNIPYAGTFIEETTGADPGTGNYMVFRNVSGANLLINSSPENPSVARAPLTGFQIVAVPEPSSTALLGLGGLALILRRRK
tara:strand:- start:3581 stop:4303 length:723 start_codon:yes stop_codon:yes gene_type:complete